jgi:GMP synthase-like glutamine amidotransferase
VRILAIVHEDDAGPGVFGEVAQARGCTIEPWRIAAGERCPRGIEAYDAVLSLGGSMDAHEHDRHAWLADEEAFLARLIDAGPPVLGVCLGAQILARAGGGSSGRMGAAEIGWVPVRLGPAGRADPLFGPLGTSFRSLQWHSCACDPVPAATRLAEGERCLQAYRLGELAWGIQFHAEVTLADFEAWLGAWQARPESGPGPEDPEALRAETRELITGWNALGRALFGRFLDQALAARASRP